MQSQPSDKFVVDNNEVVVITRSNKPDVALIAKDELSSLLETVYLLKSPANAQRLLTALSESKEEDNQPISTQTVNEFLLDKNNTFFG
ncbi:MAG: prevent-host-death protein [Symploca sp. SIO2E6]|nr:prevent-host-death protein [Symploca sp. SIO2E6]